MSPTSDRSLSRALLAVAAGRRPDGELSIAGRGRLGWMLFRHQRDLRWIDAVPGPATGLVPEFRLFGLVVTWMEADVIESTVRNLFTQGCERVYVVDNASPDDTVAVATRAGAVPAGSFRSQVQDEKLVRLHANRVAIEVTTEVWATEGAAPVWWLHVDADEFPHGPDGLTVREHLARLDRGVRVVGTTAFDHWPTSAPAFVSGAHPADTEPWCTPRWSLACRELHWKHQLVRLDADRPTVLVGDGLHRARSDEMPLVEAPRPIVVHHAPFREESATRRRLEALASSVDGHGPTRLGFNRYEMGARPRLVDAVYARRWAEIPSPNPVAAVRGVQPRPLDEVVPPDLRAFARW